MSNRWLTIVGILLLLAACAKPPRQELDAAEYLVARAYGYQALVYAPEEYRAAFAALEDSRRLIAKGDYQSAQSSLTFARLHALRAYAITDMAKAKEAVEAEARRQAEEEACRQAEEEARRQAEEKARRQAEEEARRQAETEARRKAAEIRTFTTYRVNNGDTLASIAALPEVYGDPLLWPLLYQGNRDQIKDPRQIYIGQILNIPRGLMASDLETARQKAREAGLFDLSKNGDKPAQPR
jgi:nucleoid-associated protein YgaU